MLIWDYPYTIVFFFKFILCIHLFNVYQYTVQNGFPFKNNMLNKAKGEIKTITNKNVERNKLNFRTKIKKKINFQCCKKILLIKQKKILLIKQKTLLKKTNPVKVLFAQSATVGYGFPQLYCSFGFPQTFQFFLFILDKFPNFRATKFHF